MDKDLKNNIAAEVAIPNTAISGNGTTNGNVIDMAGYQSLTFLIVGGTLTDGAFTPVVKHSDASDMTGEAEVADDFLIGSEADAALAAADHDNTVLRLGYAGKKRYVTLDLVASGVTNGGNVSVIAVKSGAKDLPVE